MIPRTKGHLGIDQDVVAEARLFRMEGGPDLAFIPDMDGLKIILFPLFVPVLVFHRASGIVDGCSFQRKSGQFLIYMGYII